jgi:hypothetical protein
MADELDEFLRQAAARRAQRQQQSASPKNANASRPAEAIPRSNNTPSSTNADNQSRIEQRRLEPSLANRHVTTDIDQSDERIDAYVVDTMQSQLRSNSATASSNPLPSKSKKKSATGSSARDSLQESATAPQSQPQNQAQVSSRDLIHQLRNPETLRMAIIAHEILRRPYQ